MVLWAIAIVLVLMFILAIVKASKAISTEDDSEHPEGVAELMEIHDKEIEVLRRPKEEEEEYRQLFNSLLILRSWGMDLDASQICCKIDEIDRRKDCIYKEAINDLNITILLFPLEKESQMGKLLSSKSSEIIKKYS